MEGWWVILKYAGVMIMYMGGENVDFNECNVLKRTIEADIIHSYEDPIKREELLEKGLKKELWSVSCINQKQKDV